MKVAFKKSFTKDLKKRSKERSVLSGVKEIIKQVEGADDIFQIRGMKKLKAEGDYYRIRFGSYRIGLIIDDDDVVTFVRVLHRSEIYRYFP